LCTVFNLERGQFAIVCEPILHIQRASDNVFPPNSEIPADAVRRAVHEFTQTYQRPTDVPWQPVRGGCWV
jgi:hypothetical protein